MVRNADHAIAAWQQDIAENGSNRFDETAEEKVFDDLHRAAAALFNGTPDDIAAGSSATELMSSLAWALMPGAETNVVSTDIVFPTAVYPWARVARHTGCQIRLAKTHGGYVDPDELAALIDDRTAVVCLSHVEFRSGQRYDLARFAQKAHAHGALLIVDSTQSAGAVPLDAPAEGIDAVIAGGYKWLCGPFGAAVLYLAPHLHKRLDPGLVGFRSNADMWTIGAEHLVFPDTARRFEFSTLAYGCGIGLARSIEYLVETGIDRIFAYNRGLADALINGLEALGAQVTSSRRTEERSAIVTARFPGRDPAAIAARLKTAGVMVAHRGDIVRFSPHLYNTMNDVDQALTVAGELAR